MTGKEQIIAILRSRKFWALLLSIITAIGAFLMQEIDVWQAVQAIVAALAIYSAGTAIEGINK